MSHGQLDNLNMVKTEILDKAILQLTAIRGTKINLLKNDQTVAKTKL